MRKLPSGKVQVRTPHGVKAKGTTPEKARKQARLLNAIDHGWKPTHQMNKSTKGSPSMTAGELGKGYRHLGTHTIESLNKVGRH
jgi:hypothetical protein